MTHYPPLPPSHPAFHALLASIPLLIDHVGTKQTALYLRREIVYGRWPGASPAEEAEMRGWLRHRIHELDAISFSNVTPIRKPINGQ